MKHLLLTVALTVPVAASAQQGEPAFFRRLANPHGYILAHEAVLYRDTLTGKPAYRLRPGDDVVVRQAGSRWFQVVRGNGEATGYSTDGTTYYLPAQAVKDARVFVLI